MLRSWPFLSLQTLIVSIVTSVSISSPVAKGTGIPSRPNNLTVSDFPPYHCTDRDDWIGAGFDASNCVAAILKFHDTELATHGSHDFEFIGQGDVPTGRVPALLTPRRYTVGKVTHIFRVDQKI